HGRYPGCRTATVLAEVEVIPLLKDQKREDLVHSQVVVGNRVSVVDERDDGLRSEKAVPRETVRAQGVPNIAPEILRQPGRDRHQEPFFLAVDHLRREVSKGCLLEEVLGLAAAQLQLARDARD